MHTSAPARHTFPVHRFSTIEYIEGDRPPRLKGPVGTASYGWTPTQRKECRKSAKMSALDNAVAGPSSEGGAANSDADVSRAGHGRRQEPLNAVAATQALPKQPL
ncbi:hypothetical protein NMY22_g16722 [Coprinellus aureogranulatus]|nr:hypothetical protein NMY22_g16722 [Coprinellus aureogranulatus]